jgi:hypothetical protein
LLSYCTTALHLNVFFATHACKLLATLLLIKPFINAKQNEKKQETDRQNRQYCKKSAKPGNHA